MYSYSFLSSFAIPMTYSASFLYAGLLGASSIVVETMPGDAAVIKSSVNLVPVRFKDAL